MEEMIKLTNGKKTIIRSKIQYEANVENFKLRGFVPFEDVKKEIKKTTLKDITDKVVQLKPKKKKNKEKEMKDLKKYWQMAKDNPKVAAGVVIVVIIILTWVF